MANYRNTSPPGMRPQTSTPIQDGSTLHHNASPITPVKAVPKCITCTESSPKKLRLLVAKDDDASKTINQVLGINLQHSHAIFKAKICEACRRALTRVECMHKHLKLSPDDVRTKRMARSEGGHKKKVRTSLDFSDDSQSIAEDNAGNSGSTSSTSSQSTTSTSSQSTASASSQSTASASSQSTASASSHSAASTSSQSAASTSSQSTASTSSQSAASNSSQSTASTSSQSTVEEVSLTSNRSQQLFVEFVSQSSMKESEHAALLEVLSKNSSELEVAQAILDSASLSNRVKGVILNDIRNVLSDLSSYKQAPGPSVLRSTTTSELMDDNIIAKCLLELRTNLPFVWDVFSTLCSPVHMAKPYTHARVAMMYSIGMNSYNKDLCAMQSINTAACLRFHANNELLNIFNKMGVTLSKGNKLAFLDKLATFNMAGVERSIRERKTGKLTCDNIDGMMLAKYIRKDVGNKTYHYTASTYYVDRCGALTLPQEVQPQPPAIDLSVFYLSEEEEAMLKKNYGHQVGRIVSGLCPQLKWMGPCTPDHIPHEYSNIMAKKSDVYPLQLILRDPKYYNGCIAVMDELIALLRTSYEKAGRLDEFDKAVFPTCGDQLVRIRMDGSKDLRGGTHTREDKLQPLFPILTEFFHVQQDFLEKMYKRLYAPHSGKVVGTLPHYRAELDRVNVNGQAKTNFQAHSDFAHTMGDALIVKLFMHESGMENLEDAPVLAALPQNIDKMHIHNRQGYFEQVTSNVVDKFFHSVQRNMQQENYQIEVDVVGEGHAHFEVPAEAFQGEDIINIDVPGDNEPVALDVNALLQRDELQNYTLQFLQWYIQYLEFADAIKEGDIFRTNVCLKMLIPFFLGHSTRSKYAVECIDFILKTEVLLPPALAIRSRLASFVNPHGGAGNNKACDMQQENCIMNMKDVIKGLGAGKSEKALVRSSKAAPVISSIVQQYQQILGIHLSDGHHKRKSDVEDIKLVLALCAGSEPFHNVPGRQLVRYRHITANAFQKINIRHFHKQLNTISKRLKRGCLEDLEFFEEYVD